jgi:ERCC4-type nuclease
MPDVQLTIDRLDLGDYVINGAVVVERKTIADLSTSIIDGRLFRQMRRLACAPERAALIVEGTRAQCEHTRVRREAIQGALIAASVCFGVAVLRATDADETARLLCYTARQLARHACGVLPRPGYRPKGLHRRRHYVLEGLPGIGPERAQRLLCEFGTIQAVCCASEKELARVRGIGRGIAARIRKVVRERDE